VSQPIQIKLLKVLEERQFSPVGSHDVLRFKGRVIAATNRPFNDIVRHKILREDFLYRMCSDVIVVPPLRQRIEEDPRELDDLLAHTVQRIIGRPSKDLATLCRKIISSDLSRDYPWPGNVRELGQCIRQILLNRTCIHAGRVMKSGWNWMPRDFYSSIATGCIVNSAPMGRWPGAPAWTGGQ